MFAGAAFTDQADIKVDSDVVDTLVSLGVVNGYTDGSFKPNDTVTRAEMAKMIYVLRTGNSDASAYNDDYSTFTDIKGHWARGYVKYCQSLGIIAGQSATKFAPDQTVTAQEAAKMLLVTLGYNAEKAGLVGINWASKTNALADENGLLEDVNTSFTAACPRQYAAQLIYNTIFAHTVALRDGEYTNMNLLGTDKLETVGEKYMGLKKWVGTYMGNADSLGIDDGQIQVEGTLDGKDYDENNKKIEPIAANFKGDLDLKYVGEEVSVLFKDVTGGTTNQPDKKDNIYGVYVTGTTKVINTTRDDIDDKTDGKKIKIDGTKYEVASIAKNAVYTVYNLNSDTTAKADLSAEAAASEFVKLNTQSGSPVKFVCDDNGKIVRAYVTDSTINKVNAVTSTKVTLNSIGGLEKEDNYIYDDAKKDDIVVATKQFNDAKYTVVKAETVTGVLKGFTEDKSKFTKVNIDGTVYKIDNKKLNDLSDDCVTKIEDSDIGSTVTAYMINGMVGALEVEEGTSNWAVVNDYNGETKLESSFKSAEVELITADGKTISGKVHKDSESAKGTAIDKNSGDLAKNLKIGNLVKYVQTSDSVIKIKEVSTKSVDINAKATIYNKDTKSLSTNAAGTTSMVVASDAPAYITNSDKDIKVYKLRDLKTMTASEKTTVNYVVDDGKVIAAYIALGARPTGSAADTVYGEITKVNGKVKVDDDYYTEYVVTCNETKYTVYTNQSGLAKKDIVSFDPTSDNIYDNNDITVYSTKSDNAKAVWVKEYDKGETLTFFTKKPEQKDNVFKGDDTALTTYAVDDDVVVAYVDLDDAGKAGEDIGVNEFSATTGNANAVIILDTDKKTILAIFVETSDKVDMASKVNAITVK